MTSKRRTLPGNWAPNGPGIRQWPRPEPLDAALIFAPVGALVPSALAATKKGGTVVSGGIHMSDIPSFPYHFLWEERVLRSVANLTRRDAEEFLALAPQSRSAGRDDDLSDGGANDALADLRTGGCTAPRWLCHDATMLLAHPVAVPHFGNRRAAKMV